MLDSTRQAGVECESNVNMPRKTINQLPSPARPSPVARRRRTGQSKPSNRRRTNAIPAAYATSIKPYVSWTSNANVCRVSGTEVITPKLYQISTAGAGSDLVFANQTTTIVPASPKLWDGTRVRALATTYMSYRPISLALEWVPAVGTSTNGQVVIGLFRPGGAEDSVDPARLLSTNGAVMSPVYKSVTARPRLDTLLDKNNYSLEELDSPFMFIVVMPAAATGTLLMHYTLDFKNYRAPTPVPFNGVQVSGGSSNAANQFILLTGSASSAAESNLTVGALLTGTMASNTWTLYDESNQAVTINGTLTLFPVGNNN